MKEWINKNWKVCLICLFVLLWFSKCAQSCSRNQIIKQNEVIINKQDSIINIQDSVLHDLQMKYESIELQLNSEKKYTANFSNIATGNQASLVDKVTELELENDYINNILNKYKKENKTLKDSLVFYKKLIKK